MIRLNEREFQDIVSYMSHNYGINLEKKKVLIECRLAKELERRNLSAFSDYLELMKRDRTGELAEGMISRLTTHYTYFLREPSHFNVLSSRIFPDLFSRRYIGNCNIWCAGCSTGEECYGLGMAAAEAKELNGFGPGIRILGTDISQDVLDQAAKAVYSIKELNRLPAAWQTKYTNIRDKKTFEINSMIKSTIRFQKHNLMEPAPGAVKYDLISCRNVMIYFNRESRERLIYNLENALNPGGYLLIGHAELLGREETSLEPVVTAVYKKKSDKKG